MLTSLNNKNMWYMHGLCMREHHRIYWKTGCKCRPDMCPSQLHSFWGAPYIGYIGFTENNIISCNVSLVCIDLNTLNLHGAGIGVTNFINVVDGNC